MRFADEDQDGGTGDGVEGEEGAAGGGRAGAETEESSPELLQLEYVATYHGLSSPLLSLHPLPTPLHFTKHVTIP